MGKSSPCFLRCALSSKNSLGHLLDSVEFCELFTENKMPPIEAAFLMIIY